VFAIIYNSQQRNMSREIYSGLTHVHKYMIMF